jgi:hypothetical protein
MTSTSLLDRAKKKVVHWLVARLRLSVGDSSVGYTGSSRAWFDCDGTNPPTAAAFRLIDQSTGEARIVTIVDGSLTVEELLT